VKIVDPKTGETVARRARGEICVKGATLMLGYINKAPEDTFDEEGYYHTGDGGYVDEAGRLFWEGRLNNIIKTGGANVSPEEVDAAIAAFPGVKRTQTVGMPHETLSEMVVACIVPVDGTTLKEDELVSFLRNRLASFKVPRKILFFEEGELALTGNEKIKLDRVRQLAANRLAGSLH
jgi:acyl-CoA synthetase (AMP-forming)/AMP-acid ligase II